jgi:DNA-binding GntR family transcriptional regulator
MPDNIENARTFVMNDRSGASPTVAAPESQGSIAQQASPSAGSKPPISEPERVAASITKGLLRREYSVGARLVEAELTAKLGVSRSTVREALKMLASRGVVDIIPHRGAVIRGLTLTEADNLLAVLEVLTGLAARLATEKINQGNNRQHFAMAAKPLIEPDESNELDRILDERARFYQAMFDVANSEDLNRAMPHWRAHLFRNQFYGFLTKGDLRAMVAEYRHIAEAILGGDAVKAELHTRRHLQKTRERVLPYLR